MGDGVERENNLVPQKDGLHIDGGWTWMISEDVSREVQTCAQLSSLIRWVDGGTMPLQKTQQTRRRTQTPATCGDGEAFD